ncbi:NnrS family protein [Nitrobacter hamburgensis]|uniref:NnrS family protein n=1 Tax=Nitrobacter hamburgensis TaxID=912 RepID=UPI0024BFEC36|nr:NnrS family protein [Nitrobacter hamburgensis]
MDHGATTGAVWNAQANNSHYRITELVLPSLTSAGLRRFEFRTAFLPHTAPFAPLSGVLLAIAGAGLLVRLLRWRGWVAASDGMVLILHLGYFWCALGLAILGASILLPANIPETAAIHALTTGAIGVMTLAMMTRTSRSHTGRERRADTTTLIIYALVNAAAVTRVLAPFAIPIYPELLVLSAACWSLAFGLFALVYGPMLARPGHRRS